MRTPLLAATLAAVLLAPAALPARASDGGPKLHVVATFSTLGSLVGAVGGDLIELSNLVPVGASPEDYQPTPRDIATLAGADVLFENGLGIESWLDRTVDNAKNDKLKTVVLSDGLPHKDDNPHLWMDPVLAKRYVAKIAATLAAADPAHRAAYERNAHAYAAQLDALTREIARAIGTIPKDQRSMLVFHNAWQYYDDRFGLQTVGVIELSPGQEPNPHYVADLVGLAKSKHVRAVFAEPEYSPKLVQALAQSAGIRTVENLYDDSIAASGPVHDYPSMLRYDTGVIVQALK
jgi:manganese/iron transport system substrate-binding protein